MAATETTSLHIHSAAAAPIGPPPPPPPPQYGSAPRFAPASPYGVGYPPYAAAGMYGPSMYDGGGAGALGGNPHLAALQQLHHAVGSVGAFTELLGMNADALQHVIGALAALLERVGQASGEIVGFLRARPPVDPATGLPLQTKEQYAAERRRKLVRWALGASAIAVLVSALRMLFRRRSAHPASSGGGMIATLLRLALFGAGFTAGGRLAVAYADKLPLQ